MDGSDNVRRREAEAALDSLRPNPDGLLMYFLEVVRRSSHPNLRSMAAVLMRRVMSQEDRSMFVLASAEVQAVIKEELLNAVKEEAVAYNRRLLCDTVAELGMVILDEGMWPELVPAAIALVSSSLEAHVLSGLTLLEHLAEHLVCSDTERRRFGELHAMYAGRMADGNSAAVRIASMRAAATLVVCLEESDVEDFCDLCSAVFKFVESALMAGDVESARHTISACIDIAEDHPVFFRRDVRDVVAACASVSANLAFPDGLRHLCVELCVTIAEKAAPMVRKNMPHCGFLATMLPTLFQMLCDVPEDSQWTATPEVEDDKLSNYNVAEEALERLAECIGARTFLPAMWPPIAAHLSSALWQEVYAGVRGLAVCARVVDTDVDTLRMIMTQLLPRTCHEHPRVRFAALTTAALYGVYHAPTLQRELHGMVLPALLGGLQDGLPRVLVGACSAVISFCDTMSAEDIAPYLDELLRTLFDVFEADNRVMKDMALTAFSILAVSAEDGIAPYYDTLMNVAQEVLSTMTAPEDRALRGRAIELGSTIGKVVGVARFRGDGAAMMDLMVRSHDTLAADDPQVVFFWQAWGRIAEALKEEFAPFLDFVVGSLLTGVTADTRIESYVPKGGPDREPAEGDGGSDDDSEEEEYEIVDNRKCLRVKTAALEEKTNAVQTLGSIIDAMGDHFSPYVERVAKAVVPLVCVSGAWFEDVRSYSIAVLPDLVKCARHTAPAPFVSGLTEYVVDALVAALPEEESDDLIITNATATKMCIENAARVGDGNVVSAAAGTFVVGPQFEPVLTVGAMERVCAAAIIVFRSSLQRRGVRVATATTSPDYDEDECERDAVKQAKEEELQFHMVDVIGILAKTHGVAFLSLFMERVLPFAADLVVPGRVASDRKFGIFMFIDVVEHCGADAAPLLGQVCPILLEMATDERSDLAQAGVYGLGAAAMSTGPAFAPAVADTVNVLLRVLNDPETARGERATVRDNAVVTLGKVILCHRDLLPDASVIGAWVTRFPVVADKEEARVALQQLCVVLEASDRDALGPGFERLSHVLESVGVMFSTEGLMTERLARRFVSAVRHVESMMTRDAVERTWNGMTPDGRRRIETMLCDPQLAGDG